MSLSQTHKSSFKKGFPTFGSRRVRMPLVEGEHVSHSISIYPLKHDIPGNSVPDITSASPASRRTIIRLPRNGYLKHIGLKIAYGTSTTADYRDHLGVGMLSHIELKSGGRMIVDITDPRTWISYALSKLDPDARIKMLANMGGTTIGSTAAAGTIMIWLPFFFDALVSPGVAPFNLNQLTSDIEIHVTLKVNTDLLKATGTGGSVTAVSAVCYILESDQSVENIAYHSYGVNNVIQESTVATATETELDVKGISGNLKKIFILNTLVTDFAVDFYKFSEVTVLKDKVNNSEENIFLAAREGGFDYIMYHNGKGSYATAGYPTVIPYTMYDRGYESNHYGGIAGQHINQHIVKLTHAAGANTYVSVMGIVSALYVHRAGGLMLLE